MKTVAIWSGISAVVFVVMVLQMTSMQKREAGDEAPTEEPAAQADPIPDVRFPENLAPAAQAQPVPTAAEYKPGQQPHLMAILRVNGLLLP